jgi:gliding motility-associated-like protein
LNPIISFFSIESHLEPIRHREENKTFSVSGSYALVLLTAISLLANPIQSSAQLDTEFWFVAPEVWAGHGDAPILLRFSTLDEAASVTVDQPANPSFPSQNVAINANGTATLDLTTWLSLIENKPSNQVLQRGLRIVSSAPITAYYEVSHPLNTEIFTLKGEAAMGTNFFTPFQTNLSNFYPQSKSAIDVIASEDNTEVTVIPTANLTNHPAGVPFTFILNAGETYGMRASSATGSDHPVGTVVSSTKPISVVVSDDSVEYGVCQDMLGDQIIPTALAGKEHIAVKGNLSGPDKVYLLATADGTTLSVNGIEITGLVLNAGETFGHNLTGAVGYYETSAPVIALHVTGFGCEVGQAVLPPVACTGSNEVAFVRSTPEFFGLKIIVRTGSEGDFTLNGSADNVGAGVFSDVPGTAGEWKYANITGTEFIPIESASRLENSSSKFHLGIINGGATTGTRYGYFSAFTQFQHETFITDDNLCEGEMAALFCSPIFGASYDWAGPNGFLDSGDAIEFGPITLADTGLYVVSGEVNGCEILPDTLELVINEQPPAPTILAIADLCEGDDWEWTSLNAADEWTWLNEDGTVIATDSTVSWTNADLDDAGSFELIISTNECASAAASFEVVVNETIAVEFANPLESACEGSDLVLSANQVVPGANWVWTLPNGTEVNSENLSLSPVEITDAGLYTLGGSNAGCPMIDGTIELEIAAPIVLEISAPDFVCSADAPIVLEINDAYAGEWTSIDCPECLSPEGSFDAAFAASNNVDVFYSSLGPCGTTTSTTIEAIATPDSNFDDFIGCEGQGDVQMAANESGGFWETDCGACSDESGLFNTAVSGVGTWNVTYSIDGLCPASSSGAFTVTPNTSSDFSSPAALCANAPIVDLIAVVSGGEWLASCGSCLSPDGSFNANEAGIGPLDVIYSIPGACGSSSTQSITILALPEASFEYSSDGFCSPALVTCIAPVNADLTDCQWTYTGNGSSVNLDCNQSTFEISEGGCFELSYTVTDNSGCSNAAQSADLLCLNTAPEATFQSNPANPSLFDEFMTLTATEINSDHAYEWNIAEAFSPNGPEVEVQLNEFGTDVFDVCLQVTDELNCEASQCQTIVLEEGITAYAPNAFTPDQDGNNDAWRMVCSDAVKSFELYIFDRWGKSVFESSNQDEFWVGDVNGGTHYAENGIYFYRAVLRGDDYEVRSLEGSIALIR